MDVHMYLQEVFKACFNFKFNPKLHLYQTWKYKGTTKMAKKCAKNVRTLGDKISVQIISIQKIYKGRAG